MSLSLKLLEKIEEPFSITEEYDLYQEWFYLPTHEFIYFQSNFQNYLEVEFFFRRMEKLLSLVFFLRKNFEIEYRKHKSIFYQVIQLFENIKKPHYFTPFHIYKFDFLEFQYNVLKKKFHEREKMEFLLLFYKGDLKPINYCDILYLIFKYLL